MVSHASCYRSHRQTRRLFLTSYPRTNASRRSHLSELDDFWGELSNLDTLSIVQGRNNMNMSLHLDADE